MRILYTFISCIDVYNKFGIISLSLAENNLSFQSLSDKYFDNLVGGKIQSLYGNIGYRTLYNVLVLSYEAIVDQMDVQRL